ncbi:MATE family efflux transporter [Pendulispora albinea]|uniref:Multidrug-efflux transporter n=1 Tax=Pendulispora albinea TaxID=2741071 RepID=A0ABZ2M691_9BACT
MVDRATRRILEGPLAKEVARFGIPLALGMALQTTFNLVDAYMVAQLPREEVGSAIGALGICDQVAALGTILSYGVSTATSSIISNRVGSGDTQGVQKAAWQSILIVTALGVLFGFLGIAFAGTIVRDIIGAKGGVAIFATRYLRVVVGGSFTIFLLLQLASIQRALGSAKTPVSLMLAGNVLNVVLAILMIFGEGPSPAAFAWAAPLAKALHIPRMGMIGAAWATIIARGLVLVPNVIILARRFEVVIPKRGARGLDREEIARILGVAWPSSAQMVIRIAAMLLVNSLVARFFTSEDDQVATTGLGLVFRVDTMALFIAMGWGSAAQTFVGQNMGASQEARASYSGWLTAIYDGITNVGLIALLLLHGETILRFFDDDPAPVAVAMHYLSIVTPTYIGLGVGIVLGNAMAGAGATRTSMWIDVAVILGLQTPLSILAVAVFDASLETLFRCVGATNVVSALVYAVVYGRGKWRRAVAARIA